jgi:trk system potassium uptake protein TrkH
MRFVLAITAHVSLFMGFMMLLPLGFALSYGESDALPIGISMGLTIVLSGIATLAFRAPREDISHREGMLITTLIWVLAGFFGALPFFLAKTFGPLGFETFINCLFESVSGFTTTGSSVLGATVPIESVGKGLLMWRSLTQWLGGMGIIVIAVAILPMLGLGGMQLFRAEASGHLHEKLRPRIRETAMALWGVYVVVSLIEMIMLKGGGMSLFDAICHTFTTISTGGFSTKDASIAFFRSTYIDTVIIVFMFIGATSFSLHFKAWTKGVGAYLRDPQFGYFTAFFVAGSAFVVLCLYGSGTYASLAEAVKYGFFQAASLMTCTGFATADYNNWPAAAQLALLIFMLMGGCAGSTAGAIKTIKIVLLFKYAKREIMRLIHPSVFAAVKFGGKVIQKNILESVLAFFVFYLFIFVLATILLALGGMNMDEAAFSTASAMGNVGPGIGATGAIGNYYAIPLFSKCVLIACMIVGRLEIFTVLVILTPGFWKK